MIAGPNFRFEIFKICAWLICKFSSTEERRKEGPGDLKFWSLDLRAFSDCSSRSWSVSRQRLHWNRRLSALGRGIDDQLPPLCAPR